MDPVMMILYLLTLETIIVSLGEVGRMSGAVPSEFPAVAAILPMRWNNYYCNASG